MKIFFEITKCDECPCCQIKHINNIHDVGMMHPRYSWVCKENGKFISEVYFSGGYRLGKGMHCCLQDGYPSVPAWCPRKDG